MDAIRVQNLRSLENTDWIDLKPITVLVGENSSGKSTLMRTLPLLRQSLETPSRGPLLWYGRLVDFGRFEDAVRKGTHSIVLSFRVPIKGQGDERVFYLPPNIMIQSEQLVADIEIEVKHWNEPPETDYVSRVEFMIAGQRIIAGFNYRLHCIALTVNGRDIARKTESHFRSVRSSLLPTPMVSLAQDLRNDLMHREGKRPVSKSAESRLGNLLGKLSSDGSRIYLPLGTNEYMASNLAKNQLWHLGEELPFGTPDEKLTFQEIRDEIIALLITYLFDLASEYLYGVAHQVRYVAPVRATADRYNRVQNLAIDEVDSQGANLAFFLAGLDRERIEEFKTWTSRLLGFSADVTPSGPGHISITLSESTSKVTFNIADKGFGYSQILPVLAQMWHVAVTNPKERYPVRGLDIPVMVAVEQPELHLHPRFQAMVVDGIVDLVAETRGSRAPLRVIMETHSETIINRLGQHVAKGMIDPKDINLLVFELDRRRGISRLRRASYSEDGFLEGEWPYGFFNME